MSEWTSVLAVFWVLWALDGVRLAPRWLFTLIGDPRPRRARIFYARWGVPGFSPTSWRITVADVPVSLSPEGVCNVPTGSAGRPAETPARAQAWRWAEVREVGVANGWIYVNGARFCADTGHVSAPELLALARLDPTTREKRIRAIVRRWFRPAHLRRRARVLAGRTPVPTLLNVVTLAGFVALTVYVVGGFAERLSPRTSAVIGDTLPAVVGALFLVHLTAVIVAWRTVKRLRPVAPQKRGAALFSALLLPPQALRLRALLGEGFFPAQHPLAAIGAFGRQRALERWGFCVLADFRWPLPLPGGEPPLAREIVAWFRPVLEPQVERLIADKGIAIKHLLAAPTPDAPQSCSYCPRCRDQFVGGPKECPHGVALQPFRSGEG